MLQGVEHTHVAVANLILVALHDTLPHSGLPVVLCHADNSTSSALLEIWAALLTGGSLALKTEATNVSIGQVICQAGVTAALLTGDELESILEVRYNFPLCLHLPWCCLIRHTTQRNIYHEHQNNSSQQNTHEACNINLPCVTIRVVGVLCPAELSSLRDRS